MAKVKKTNAIRMVEQKKLSYQEYTYEWSEDHLDAGSVAQQIAHPEAIYKTLVAVGNKTGSFVSRVRIYYTAELHFTFSTFYEFPLVGNYSYRPAINSCSGTNDRFTIIRFIFFKL